MNMQTGNGTRLQQRLIQGNAIFLSGCLAALFLWLFESVLHAWLFRISPLREELLPIHDPHELWMRVFLSVFVILSGLVLQRAVTALRREHDAAQQTADDLKKALDEIRTLRGIITICSSCRQVMDDKGAWGQLEHYISEHSDAEFSHGICPKCAKEIYKGFI